MKRFIFSSCLILFSCATFACPFCGCGNSNFQVGILPTYKNAFVGVRYTYSHFNTLSRDGTQFSHDYFHTTEIWGGIKIGKIQLMTFVPYITSHKLSDDGDINDRGIGDVLFLTNYQVFSVDRSGTKEKKAFNNSLWLGAGIKFRTGHSQVDVNNPDFTVGDFSSTPGTGSTDYLLNAMHNFIVGDNGIITNAAFRFNTVNAQQFRYGNRMYFNTAYFHSWSFGNFVLRPSVGLNLVVNNSNRYQGQEITGSSGYIFSGMGGLNVQRGKVGLLVNGFLPVRQNLFEGQTRFESRGSVALTVSF